MTLCHGQALFFKNCPGFFFRGSFLQRCSLLFVDIFSVHHVHQVLAVLVFLQRLDVGQKLVFADPNMGATDSQIGIIRWCRTMASVQHCRAWNSADHLKSTANDTAAYASCECVAGYAFSWQCTGIGRETYGSVFVSRWHFCGALAITTMRDRQAMFGAAVFAAAAK